MQQAGLIQNLEGSIVPTNQAKAVQTSLLQRDMSMVPLSMSEKMLRAASASGPVNCCELKY